MRSEAKAKGFQGQGQGLWSRGQGPGIQFKAKAEDLCPEAKNLGPGIKESRLECQGQR